MYSPRPEFSVSETKGVKVGRIFVHRPSTQSHSFLTWYQSVHVINEVPYSSGDKVIEFIALKHEYDRLAAKYPHSNPVLRSRTEELLQ